jgi:hypothetical protein
LAPERQELVSPSFIRKKNDEKKSTSSVPSGISSEHHQPEKIDDEQEQIAQSDPTSDEDGLCDEDESSDENSLQTSSTNEPNHRLMEGPLSKGETQILDFDSNEKQKLLDRIRILEQNEKDREEKESNKSISSQVHTVVHVSNTPVVYLTGENLTPKRIENFIAFINQQRNSNQQVEPEKYMHGNAALIIESHFMSRKYIKEGESRSSWKEWTMDKFLSCLSAAFPAERVSGHLERESLSAQLARLTVELKWDSIDALNAHNNQILAIYKNFPDGTVTREEEIKAVKTLMALLDKPRGSDYSAFNKFHLHLKSRIHSDDGGPPTSVVAYIDKLVQKFNSIAESFKEVKLCGSLSTMPPRAKLTGDNLDKLAAKSNGKRPFSKSEKDKKCSGCGREHDKQACILKGHPDWNHSEKPFKETTQAQKLRDRGVKNPDVLPFNHRVDGAPWADAPTPPNSNNNPKKKRGENLFYLPEVFFDHLSYLLPCDIFINDPSIDYDYSKLSVLTLFDTGAIQGNFVNPKTAAWIHSRMQEGRAMCHIANSEATKRRKVSLASTGKTCYTLGNVVFNFKFFNELIKTEETIFCLKATIIDTDIDLIIGRPTIRATKLVAKLPSYFMDNIEEASVPLLSCNCCNLCQQECTLTSKPIAGADNPNRDIKLIERGKTETKRATPNDGALSPVARAQIAFIREGNKKHIKELIDYEDDPDVYLQSDDFDWDIAPTGKIDNDEEILSKITFDGSPELQASLKELVREFKDIFSEHVKPEPADVPAFDLKIDLTKWQVNSNRGPPRQQSGSKEAEIQRQVAKLTALNVIEVASTSEYSHVHLVPKPDATWRFCLDYVKLNSATNSTEGWPIPNIANLIVRIGKIKPKHFAIMDLTSGYHQAPISKSSRPFTAFITFMGVYQWLRVPMGLKGAASYFQRVMATIVLAGLLYIVCELYLDDILVYGQDPEQFIKNLRAVFTQFRRRRIAVNPKKTKLGLSSVEYVGHTLSAEGVSFSREKLGKVLDFPLPTDMHTLKSFIGLVNYFRSHVRNMSTMLKPLQDMLSNYHKKTKLVWTEHHKELYAKGP